MAFWDRFVGPSFKDDSNMRGELKDNETWGKKMARQEAKRKGRANLFDSHPDNQGLLPLKRHIKERIPLRPEHGRPWYKTYRIREQVSQTGNLTMTFCLSFFYAFSLGNLTNSQASC